jgi:hypothetical protein
MEMEIQKQSTDEQVIDRDLREARSRLKWRFAEFSVARFYAS